MPARYAMRDDHPEGWTVYDIWTGWPAKIACVDQTELAMTDAQELMRLLNGLHERGHRLNEMGPPGSSGLGAHPSGSSDSPE